MVSELRPPAPPNSVTPADWDGLRVVRAGDSADLSFSEGVRLNSRARRFLARALARGKDLDDACAGALDAGNIRPAEARKW